MILLEADPTIAWRTTRGAAYVPSPIIEGDYFLVVSDSGVGHCFEASSGKLAWAERLGERIADLESRPSTTQDFRERLTVRLAGPLSWQK